MSRVMPAPRAVAPDLAREWAERAAWAAADVPAAGAEAVHWTVRGWAEVALGCVLSDTPYAFDGLDAVVRAAGIPCSGPFGDRLRSLRSSGGTVPAYYRADPLGPAPAAPLAPAVAHACLAVAEFCELLTLEIAGHRDRGRPAGGEPPHWAGLADHLRWGERIRPRPLDYRYEILPAPVDRAYVWRAWMCLPSSGGPRIVLAEPGGTSPATPPRRRVCHGIHNGAHLDYLGALEAEGMLDGRSPAPAEFGAGLLAAEAFAMAVEALAAVECTLDGSLVEAEHLVDALIERIGRIPGYRGWYAAAQPGSRTPALTAATRVAVGEFAALPHLAASYMTGLLRVLGGADQGPASPAGLLARLRLRWDEAAERSAAAAVLSRRAAESPVSGLLEA